MILDDIFKVMFALSLLYGKKMVSQLERSVRNRADTHFTGSSFRDFVRSHYCRVCVHLSVLSRAVCLEQRVGSSY